MMMMIVCADVNRPSSRLHPRRTCEQEHMGLSSAFLHNSAAHAKICARMSGLSVGPSLHCDWSICNGAELNGSVYWTRGTTKQTKEQLNPTFTFRLGRVWRTLNCSLWLTVVVQSSACIDNNGLPFWVSKCMLGCSERMTADTSPKLFTAQFNTSFIHPVTVVLGFRMPWWMHLLLGSPQISVLRHRMRAVMFQAVQDILVSISSSLALSCKQCVRHSVDIHPVL